MSSKSSAVATRSTRLSALARKTLPRSDSPKTQQFPELDSDMVTRTVYSRYHEIDDSPVRGFIPVLVERTARERLKTATTGGHS